VVFVALKRQGLRLRIDAQAAQSAGFEVCSGLLLEEHEGGAQRTSKHAGGGQH